MVSIELLQCRYLSDFIQQERHHHPFDICMCIEYISISFDIPNAMMMEHRDYIICACIIDWIFCIVRISLHSKKFS